MFRCKYGHEFSTTPKIIREDYGCPVCSNHRTKNVPIIERVYNLTLLLGIPPTEKYTGDIGGVNFKTKCPFCGKSISRVFRSFTSTTDKKSCYCECLEGCNAKVIPLGLGLDNRFYYGVDVYGKCFLGIADSLEEGIILDKTGLLPSEFSPLDDGVFKSSIGDPYIMTVKLNSYNSIPVNKSRLRLSVDNTEVAREQVYGVFKYQKEHGLSKPDSAIEYTTLVKKDITKYLKSGLEKELGFVFVENRTVGWLNMDLFCKQVDKSVIIKINAVHPQVLSQLDEWFSNGGLINIAVITDIPDYADETRGFYYLNRVQKSDTLEDTLHELLSKIVDFCKQPNII